MSEENNPIRLIINDAKIQADQNAQAERERINGYLGMTPETFDFEIEAPEWAFDKVIPAQSVGMIYGSPGAGKTQLALSMADAILSGAGSWCDRPICSGDVVLFCESPGNTKARMIGYRSGKNHAHNLYVYDTPLFDVEQIKDLGLWLLVNRVSPAAIIFDTVSTSFDFGGDGENSNSAVARMLRALQSPLNWVSGFIAIIHHTAKNSDQYRGASALLGNCDWTIQLTRDPDLDTPVAYLGKDKWHLNECNPAWVGEDRRIEVSATNGTFPVTITNWSESSSEQIDLAKAAVQSESKDQKLGMLESKLLDAIDEMLNSTGLAVIRHGGNVPAEMKSHQIQLGTKRSDEIEHLLQMVTDYPAYAVDTGFTKRGNQYGVEIRRKN